MTSKKPEPLTSVLRNGVFSSSYDSLVQGSSTVLRLNFCAINPPLRKAAKRYASVATTKKTVGNNEIENPKFRKSLTESCA